ncbi:MAG TPA: ATP-grasp domain-containing protein [Candidatus Bipolaricaulota bacterium]|nr:ATP-grasp domain-containing protein [Candidatus Bipolaricaulota bacterium]
MILTKQLIPSEIPFLCNKRTLYLSDFRAISESMLYEIPAMWKYENLLPWILDGQYVIVNDDFGGIEYNHGNNILPVRKAMDPRVSVFERVKDDIITKNEISSLWVSIPHPKADALAKENKLSINYNYSEFKKYNDKLSQKDVLKSYTPEWKKINNVKELDDFECIHKPGFLKRRFGSGGYTVFLSSEIKCDLNFRNLFSKTSDEWYWEALALGIPHSIQCVRYRESGDTIIFGFSEQLIAENKYFVGSKILPLEFLDDIILRQLRDVLSKINIFLEGYEGFFGVDFMVESETQKISVLELNVRMTAATIPTLLMNELRKEKGEYREDVPLSQVQQHDIILTKDVLANTADILRYS